MKNLFSLHILGLFALVILTFACERTKQINHEDMEIAVLKSGHLELSAKKDFPKSIYIDIRDETGNLPLTPEYLPKMLKEDNFEVVDNPSKAAYILHIFLLREGQTNPDVLKQLVEAGYDNNATFSGEGHSAWLADALLVQRRIPEAQRQSHIRLKNISARNALGNSQMRIAISSPVKMEGRKEFAQAFAKSLAQAIRETLTPDSVAAKGK